MAWARSRLALGAILAVFLAGGRGALAGSPPAKTQVTLRGEVLELTEVLKPLNLGADNDPVARQVVLKGDDGAVVPLLSDDASRAFFLDKRLRHRPAEIVANRIEGLPYVQVLTIKVDDHGQMRTPEYFCDICTISVRYPQACPCCQGPMVLRYRSGDQ